MVYFICGHRGCGKSFIVNQLSNLIDCSVFDTGPILRNFYSKNSCNCTFGEWIDFGVQKYGKDFTNKVICENLDINMDDINIIIGNRSLEGIFYIINYFNIDEYKICFIDGDYNLFRENYNYRENKNLNLEDFNKIIKVENDMGIESIESFVKNNINISLYYYKDSNDDTILEGILADINKNRNVKSKKFRR